VRENVKSATMFLKIWCGSKSCAITWGENPRNHQGKLQQFSFGNESHICGLRRKVKMTKRMAQIIIGHSPINRGYVWIFFASTKSERHFGARSDLPTNV